MYCWVVFALMYPVINSLGSFPHLRAAWYLLLTVSLIVLPLYILYARIVVPRFLFTKRYLFYGGLTSLLFLLVHGLVFLLFAIALVFDHDPWTNYFKYSGSAIAPAGR